MARRRRENTEMATDVQEITDATETTPESAEVQSEKAKRERVDLEALDPNERVTLMLTMPAAMKLQLTKAGEDKQLVASAYARNLLADAIGFQIPDSFLETTRTHKYASDEERAAANKAKAAEKREQVKRLLELVKSGKIDASLLS